MAESKSIYEDEKKPYDKGCGDGVLQCARVRDQLVCLVPDLPSSVIVVHGVNDVGVAYGEVEAGLCAGLNARLDLGCAIRPAQYRTFTDADRNKLEEDPDAVFYKRTATPQTYSPVIPFYWGYREENGRYLEGKDLPHGQNTDRFGNRLDKDFSKGGGPFVNATGTLPDMWNRGSVNSSTSEWIGRDPMRPLLSAPGRLYMVLAAQRLAALVSMIRDYEPDETVSLVAHSQGCMVSLLAQAFLAQQGLRPADTLVLTHPPYSLEDELDLLVKTLARPDTVKAEDGIMKGRYDALEGRQTLHARLQTLVNIVELVASRRGATPAFDTLKSHPGHVVGAKWEATGDRDNRGKVYLYFCPEDMTVAFKNVKGIGWQGVPELQRGRQAKPATACDSLSAVNQRPSVSQVRRRPFLELTRWNRAGANGKFISGFFQRVFTQRRRPDARTGQPVLVGQARPHDHILRLDGENEGDHAAQMEAWHPINDGARQGLPRADLERQRLPLPRENDLDELEKRRRGMVVINGEPLPRPVEPDMAAGALPATDPRMPAGDPAGSWEAVDAIDAAIATTSTYGARLVWQLIDDPAPTKARTAAAQGAAVTPLASPAPALHPGPVVQDSAAHCEKVRAWLNQGKSNTQSTPAVTEVYQCLAGWPPKLTGKLLVQRKETPDEVRLHWQNDVALRSCHSAIFGSRLNHQNVTAYDVAIGQGKAVSDPRFRAYLCAVADWRLKKPKNKEDARRPGILLWDKFLEQFGKYYSKEPKWRRALIDGNSDYYSTGKLPQCVAVLPEGLPLAVVCETVVGRRINSAAAPSQAQACTEAKAQWNFGDIDVVQPNRDRGQR